VKQLILIETSITARKETRNWFVSFNESIKTDERRKNTKKSSRTVREVIF